MPQAPPQSPPSWSDALPLLQCVACGGPIEVRGGEQFACGRCGRAYPLREGFLDAMGELGGNNKVAADFYDGPLWPKFRFWEHFTFFFQGGARRARRKVMKHLPELGGTRLLEVAIGDGSNLLMLSFSGVGGLITEVTSLDPVGVTAMPFGEFECILTKGGGAHPAKSFRLAVANNVRQRRGIRGSAPASFKRGFIDQPEGQEEVTGEVVRYVKSGLDMQAASMSGSDLVLTCADLATGTNTLVITATDAQYGAERIAPSMEDDILYTTPFEATGVTFA